MFVRNNILEKKVMNILEDFNTNQIKSFNLEKCNFFDTDIRKMIEEEGRKVFKFYKGVNRKFINKYLQTFNPDLNVKLETGDKNYLEKNLEDIEFALNNLPLSRNLTDKLINFKIDIKEELESNLTIQHESLQYFKEGDKWSLINKFDNNVKLWKECILFQYRKNGIFKKIADEKNNCYDAIKSFFTEKFFTFDNTNLTFAQYHFLDNISFRLEKAKNIVSLTSQSGDETELSFINHMKKEYKLSDDRIYNFSSSGGILDLNGIDLAIKTKKGYWKPIQVKPDLQSAMNSIPYGGISVYPTPPGYQFVKRENGEIKVSNL